MLGFIPNDDLRLRRLRRKFRFMPPGTFDVEPIVEMFDQPEEPLLLIRETALDPLNPDWQVDLSAQARGRDRG